MANKKAISKANLELALTENNKKVKEYVDTGNQELTSRVDEIKKYQKYLNTELDYFRVSYSSGSDNLTVDAFPHTLLLPDTTTKKGIEYDATTGIFKLKAGKTYLINLIVRVNFTSNNAGILQYSVHNKTTSKDLIQGLQGSNTFAPPNGGNYSWTDKDCIDLITVEEDTEIYCRITAPYPTSATIGLYRVIFFIQEIGRQTIIDPIEHANEKYGIEDTPVGHIISHMGTLAPKHYLICDGTEYNIIEYPYLAQHFIDQFGSVNYFGGDGITTFATPDLRGEFLRGTGTALRNTGSGAEVGEHQDPTLHQNMYVSTSTICFYGDPVGASKKNVDTMVNMTTDGHKLSYTDYTASNSASLITSRPTNTSVLYCIKYEPTYYIQNYATKFQETTLWEGSAIVDCSTDINSQNIDLTINLSDSIKNYDRIEIRYGALNTTGNIAYPTICQIIPDDVMIDGLNCDVSLTISYGQQYNFTCIGSFIDEQTLFIQSKTITGSSFTGNEQLQIYKIVGLKPAKPVYDVAINCDNDYSTEERVIGRWVDGKLLYEKTIRATTTGTELDTRTVLTDVSDLNIERFIHLEGTLFSDSYHVTLNNEYLYLWYRPNENTIVFKAYNEQYLNQEVYIKIQYTKASDPTTITTRKSYSLDETLTGDTWIDGKPIYRRVVKCTSPSTTGSGSQIYTLPTDIEVVTKIDGTLVQDTNAIRPVNMYISNTNHIATYIYGGNLHMIVSDVYISKAATIILEYTKSE